MLGEREAPALRETLLLWPMLVSSSLLIVESIRACTRYGAEFATRAQTGLATLALLPLDDAILHAAAALEPPGLRSLDAIHLATAVSLGDRLGALVCYDERLASAGDAAGIEVLQPQ